MIYHTLLQRCDEEERPLLQATCAEAARISADALLHASQKKAELAKGKKSRSGKANWSKYNSDRAKKRAAKKATTQMPKVKQVKQPRQKKHVEKPVQPVKSKRPAKGNTGKNR